jgi:hypothetical protein
VFISLLSIFHWHIIGKVTIVLAEFNFILNPDPYGRFASIGVVLVLLALSKIARKYEKTR